MSFRLLILLYYSDFLRVPYKKLCEILGALSFSLPSEIEGFLIESDKLRVTILHTKNERK